MVKVNGVVVGTMPAEQGQRPGSGATTAVCSVITPR